MQQVHPLHPEGPWPQVLQCGSIFGFQKGEFESLGITKNFFLDCFSNLLDGPDLWGERADEMLRCAETISVVETNHQLIYAPFRLQVFAVFGIVEGLRLERITLKFNRSTWFDEIAKCLHVKESSELDCMGFGANFKLGWPHFQRIQGAVGVE